MLAPKRQNRRSRYTSFGYDASCDCWSVLVNVDHRSSDPRVPGVRAEGACKSSWAITAVNSVELSYALVASAIDPNNTGALPPPQPLSVQQVADCSGGGSNCGGGWPTASLDYLAWAGDQYGGLTSNKKYGYLGKAKPNTCVKKKLSWATSSGIAISRFEQVDFYGWMGLLLAVQVQPVIVFVRGSYPSFQRYKSGVYSDPNCMAGAVVDHSVLVVGYDYSGPDGSLWLLRNSWGTKWGEAGHMRMAMSGGQGICGIHSVPAIYPIISVFTVSVCDSPQNPCGGGTCNPSADNTWDYNCTCPDSFVSIWNDDGMPACGPAKVCSSYGENPCACGTCLDDQAGGFFCLCPPQYERGWKPNGAETCVPTKNTPTSLTFPADVACDMVYQLFGLTQDQFTAQNPNLPNPCDTIPANTEVYVHQPTACINCNLYYSWSQSDTCDSVACMFETTVDEVLRLNPGITCDAGSDNLPMMNQQICVQEGNGMDYPMCKWWYSVQPGDNCTAIMARFNLDAYTFFALNPGLSCDNLFPYGSGSDTMSGIQVCTSGSSYAASSIVSVKSLPTAASSPTALSAGISARPFFAPLQLPITFRKHRYQQAGILSAVPSPRTAAAASGAVGAAAVTPMATAKRCLATYKVVQGDFCARITALKFNNSPKKMADLNNGYVCSNQRLYVGLVLCTKR